MAAARFGGSILKHFSGLNTTPAWFCVYRGFASTLFVKGISFRTTNETLAVSFSKFGEVLEAKVIMHKAKARNKGFGYVTFVTEEDATRALTVMNGQLLDGRVVFVDTVTRKPRAEEAGKEVANPIGDRLKEE